MYCLVIEPTANDPIKLLTIVFSVFVTLYADKGGARHRFFLDPPQLQEVTKLNWLAQPFSIIGFAIGKVSVAILCGRLMGPSKWRKRFLYFLSISVMALGIPCVTLLFVQCSPAKALWEPSAGKCWNPKVSIDFDILVGSMYTLVMIWSPMIVISICRLLLFR